MPVAERGRRFSARHRRPTDQEEPICRDTWCSARFPEGLQIPIAKRRRRRRARRSSSATLEEGVTWVHSYVSADKRTHVLRLRRAQPGGRAQDRRAQPAARRRDHRGAGARSVLLRLNERRTNHVQANQASGHDRDPCSPRRSSPSAASARPVLPDIRALHGQHAFDRSACARTASRAARSGRGRSVDGLPLGRRRPRRRRDARADAVVRLAGRRSRCAAVRPRRPRADLALGADVSALAGRPRVLADRFGPRARGLAARAQLLGQRHVLGGGAAVVAPGLEHARQLVEPGFGHEHRATLLAELALAHDRVPVAVGAERDGRVVDVERAEPLAARPSRSNSSIDLGQRRRESARRSPRRTGGRSRGRCPRRLPPPEASISSASSSNERPSVPPAPAVSSSSSGQRSVSASASLITLPARLIALGTSPCFAEPGMQNHADRADPGADAQRLDQRGAATSRASRGPRWRS